jgi:hypothetical protein
MQLKFLALWLSRAAAIVSTINFEFSKCIFSLRQCTADTWASS